jgi:hydrogenase maturation protein HypF
VAIKGLGGFHLMVDAANDKAVRKLRSRKNREEKPLAIMCPDLNSVKVLCLVNNLEEKLLVSPVSPIVLLKRRKKVKIDVASSVSPGNPYLGVMLPYTPMHLILMSVLNTPVVATSGNLSDEPICIDEQEALERLGRVADLFLVHNRPIARHVDDSVVRVMGGRELIIRRARGYSPLPIAVKKDLPPLLGVGGHLKNSVALAVENDVFLSQHIGDIETSQAEIAFCEVIDHFRNIYEKKSSMLACDMHPDYYSTHFARKNGKRIFPVQHHLAHILSCMAENHIDDPVLGISWDGTGYGLDGTVWGGEFLKVEKSDWQRVATFRQFPLPGSEKAVQEPRRTAVGLLYEIFGGDILQTDYIHFIKEFDKDEIAVLLGMIKKSVNTPLTSSVGRLFDAAASLLNIRQINTFEGQAAMELEFSASDYKTEETYNLNYKSVQVDKGNSLIIIDWEPMFREILRQVENGEPTGLISAKFHNTLAKSILEMARRAAILKTVLSGGCFQNKYLTERVIHILKGNGFEPVWHHLIPPNDGGIALGQIMEAARVINSEAKDVYRDSRTD